MEKDKRKIENRKKRNSGENPGRRIGQGILSVYFVVVSVIYPYYAPGGYLRIGEAKYAFFLYVTLAALAAMFMAVIYAVIRRPELVAVYYRGMSVTDWFAYGYFVAVMLSYLCSAHKEEALLGAEGWHMGAVMQMIFVLLYFFFSRYFVCSLKWLAVWLTAAAGVFLLGILNRYSIYPFVMEGQTPLFISTLGNINWFCGYWSVTAPIGMALYWSCKRRWQRAAAGCYSLLAVLAGIVQGSESAYLVFAAVYAVLWLFSIHSVERFLRWVELCMIFAAGCQLGRFLRCLPGFDLNYGSAADGGSPSVMDRLTGGNVTLWMFCILLVCYVMLRLWIWRKGAADGKMLRTSSAGRGRRAGCAVAAAALLGIGAYGLSCADGLWYDGEDSGRIIIFDEDWGNGRGAAWICAIEAFRSLDTLHRAVGVGPDCFAAYIYGEPVLAERLVEGFGSERLTNAHNEALSRLINVGVCGFVCYAGFVGSALIRYSRRADGQILLYACAMGILAYTVHNVVSFQQVLSTPFFFILSGMGEGLLREGKERL